MKRVIALTEAGRKLGQRLCRKLDDADLWYKPEPFAERIRQAFSDGDVLIMICASGIVVRTLAPVIDSKHRDPAVLVLDEGGRFVIPLLSGHEGGANDLGAELAELLGAELVLTTANSYLHPVYAAGLGSERGCDAEELQTLLSECLAQAGLDTEQLESVASIDIKADEKGMIKLAEDLGLEFQTYSAEELKSMEALLSTRSDYVFDTVGVYGVAESAALLAASRLAGGEAELVVTKRISARATCSIARAYPIEA